MTGFLFGKKQQVCNYDQWTSMRGRFGIPSIFVTVGINLSNNSSIETACVLVSLLHGTSERPPPVFSSLEICECGIAAGLKLTRIMSVLHTVIELVQQLSTCRKREKWGWWKFCWNKAQTRSDHRQHIFSYCEQSSTTVSRYTTENPWLLKWVQKWLIK